MNANPDPLSYARRVAHLKASAVRDMLKTAESPQIISFAGGLPDGDLLQRRYVRSRRPPPSSEWGSLASPFRLSWLVTPGGFQNPPFARSFIKQHRVNLCAPRTSQRSELVQCHKRN
jgi:hypothetical protein